jgi:hypothetical protein
LELTLTRDVDRIGFDSTRESREEVQAFWSGDPLTFPWTGCRTGNGLQGSLESTSRSKTTLYLSFSVSFIMDRDIFLCQK